MGLTLVLASAAYIVWNGKHYRRGMEMSWGLLWFAAAHAPDMGILVPINSRFMEHWMYLPTVGLFLGSAQTISNLIKARPQLSKATVALSLVFVALLSVKTFAQNEIWHDPVIFYANIFKYHEPTTRAHSNLAVYYLDNGNYASALEQLNQALAIGDNSAVVRHNMAVTYLHMPDAEAHIQDMINNLNRAVEIEPNFYRSWQLLGDLYDIQGDKEKAASCHNRAAALTRH